MPLPISLAHQLAKQLAAVRTTARSTTCVPDGKTQVSVRYVDGAPVGDREAADLHAARRERDAPADRSTTSGSTVVLPVLPADLYDANALRKEFLVNPTGRFVIGGPVGDCGLTGRKIIVDTYGGMARHGGGAFSGKDPSKVDRSRGVRGALGREEHRRRRPRRSLRGAGRVRDRRRAPGQRHGRDVRHREDRPRQDRGARRRALRPASRRVSPGARPAPADLPEDRRVRPLRPRRPGLHVGADRQGRRAARRRRRRSEAVDGGAAGRAAPFYPSRSPWPPTTATTPPRSSPAGSRCGPTRARGRSPTTRDDPRPTSYVLEMLPYPSGEPHIGHLKVYSVGDAVAHFHRRTGRRVLHPMGYDAFGLPAENHAIKTGQHPRDSTERRDRAVPARSSASGASRSTGRASSAPTSRASTAGRSGSSSSSSSAASPTRRRRRSTGIRSRRPCSPTSRSRTAAASAPARSSRCASSRSGSSASPTTPTGCSRTSRRSTGPSTSRRCSATGSAAPRAPRSSSAARTLGTDYPVFTTRPDTLFGATFFVMAPEHPDVLRLAEGTEPGGRGARVRQPRADRRQAAARRRRQAEDRRRARPHRDEPRQRRAAADVRRRLRPHGVRHRRDHGGARRTTSATSRSPRRTTCRSGASSRTPTPRRRAAVHRRRAARQLRARVRRHATTARRSRAIVRLARRARARATRRSTTACATG